MEAAAILGAIAGDAGIALEVLEHTTPEQIEESRRLAAENYCRCYLEEHADNLYIKVLAHGQHGEYAIACLEHRHTFFSRLEKNGKVLLDHRPGGASGDISDLSRLSLEGIWEFAACLHPEDLRDVLERQLQMNDRISRQGLSGDYGANIGRTLLESGEANTVYLRARARAAAGSDARMNGCPLPVVINAGSGNQGIAISVPILEYAESFGVERDILYRALALGNLVSLHLKKYIGSLSAYCGATNAACGAACGIAYLQGGGLQLISDTITNTLSTIGGMACDGAKSSCAAKISVALESAFNGLLGARRNRVFQNGEGLVEQSVEQTIQNWGHIGRDGMRATDLAILHLMLQNPAEAAGYSPSLAVNSKQ